MADPIIETKPAAKPVTPAPGKSGAEQMRAFEDNHFGKGAVRINGQVERGHGSAFAIKMMESPQLRSQHAAIERLIEAEKNLGEAEGALSVAQSDHATAKAAVDEAAKAAEAAQAAMVKAQAEEVKAAQIVPPGQPVPAKPLLEPAHTGNL